MTYEERWRQYRRLHKWNMVLFLSAPVWFIAGDFFFRWMSVGSRILDPSEESLVHFFFVVGPWTLALLYLNTLIAVWPCPRCGRPFSMKWWGRPLVFGRCVHCGLRKFQKDGREQASDRHGASPE